MNKLIKKSLTNFCSLNILQKIILVIIPTIFLLLFIQNFIFSSSFDILMFRSVDDFAFQHVLRKNHESIIQFRLEKLFKLYEYGYGWLFWIIHTVITFPFYLISLLGVDFLLISAARNISLFFMAGSCFLLFKSIKKYTNDEYIPYFVVLLYVSYPYFAFSSMSFRTIAQGSFFCILTFYLIVRNSALSKKDLKYIAISFAACLGTKLSNAVFAPLIALFLIDRFGFKLNKENFKKAFFSLKYFIPSSIFFINPSLFIAPFKWSLFTKYRDVMSYYFKNVQTNYGSGGSFLKNFQDAFSTDFLYKYILAILTLVFLVRFIYDVRSNKQNKFDFLYIFIFLAFSSLYLTNHIKMGAVYITNYFFSFSFLLLLPLVTLEKVEKYTRITVLMTLVTLNTALNFNAIKHSYLFYYTQYNSQTTQTLLESQKELQKLVGDPDQKLNLLIDYRAPVIYSNFRKNITTITMFDNVSEFKKESNSEFDYILLHKDSKMLLDKKDFQRISVGADEGVKNILTESRGMIESLINTGIFRESRYEVIYDKNKLICFKFSQAL